MTEARVAIVTGGASGIGRAVAERLAADGCRVAVVDLNSAQAGVVAGAIGGVAIQADLSRRADCRRAVDETVAHFGRVDILVNNAGFQHIAPIAEFPEDAWDKLLAVMLTAPFLLTKYVWPGLAERGWGRIVNVSSIHGKVASPFKAGYVSAKHGLIGLTRTAALEGGSAGITVNAICPAYVRTPLVENQIAEQAQRLGIGPDAVVSDVMLESAAIKRLIEPDEIAALVAYLCSNVAGAVTGAAWDIDMGWTAR
jgi:3-hydroxybutyrate dehydrogenase